MKTIIHSVQNLPRSFASPLNRAMLPLFFTLAFLPSILHLATFYVAVTNPFAALGPLIAAFWLAASLCGIRVNFFVIGIIVAALFWSANWMMSAGDNCCASLTK